MTGIVYTMYHELEKDGRRLCQDDPGYVRYVMHEDCFRAHVDALARSGLRGISTIAPRDARTLRPSRCCAASRFT